MPGTLTAVRTRAALVTAGLLLAAGAATAVPDGWSTAAPATLPDAATQLNDCVSADNGSVTVTSTSVSPSTVDVSDSPAQVTLTVHAVDTGGPGAASGVWGVSGDWASPDIGSGDVGRFTMEPGEGDAWTTVIDVPRYAEPGEWRVSGTAFDKAGNDPRQDDGIAFRTSFTVTSAPKPDTTRPTIRSLRVAPGRVRAGRHGATARVTVDATDRTAAAGDVEAGVARVRVGAHRGPFRTEASLVEQDDGTFAGDLRIPRWEGGTWRIDTLLVHDAFGNVAHRRGASIDELGNRELRVSGPSDTRPPSLLAGRPSRTTVDIRRRGRQVVVRAHLRDRPSGVRRVRAYLSGEQAELHRVGGTSTDGLWRGTVRLTPCSRPGRHRVWLGLHAWDRVGNVGDELLGKVHVLHQDLAPPRFVVRTTDAAPGGPVRLAFTEPVRGINDLSAVVQRYVGPEYADALAGSWSCSAADGSSVSCDTGPATAATWAPSAPLPPRSWFRVLLDPEGNLDVVDRNGIPCRRAEDGFRTAP